MTVTEVDSGQCGNTARIKAELIKENRCRIEIETQCPQIQALAEEIRTVNPETELNRGSSQILYRAARCCHHTFCPVPSAIIKTVEAEAGMIEPDRVFFKITKYDSKTEEIKSASL